MRRGRLAAVLALAVLFAWPVAVRAGALEAELVESAAAGDVLLVEALLDHGAEVDGGGPPDGVTPLVAAVGSGHRAVVALLLERGADVNRRTGGRGNTPLIVAASRTGGLAWRAPCSPPAPR